ncbi:hypothetical protein CJJ07_005560 [Candidozyma auris]|nr:hypothetical protein CJJ07_005560 [[Candida] auris]QEL60675.1 hypothetical protein CJJ09_002789 [[Candida] auris]
MVWLYVPVCIRLVSQRSDVPSQSYSGIYLVNKDGTSFKRHFCISICHTPVEEIDKYKMYVSCKPLMRENGVQWVQGIRGTTVPVLSEKNDALREYLQYALKNGFNMIPLDTFVGNSLQSMTVMVVHCRAIHTEIDSKHLQSFHVEQAQELTKVTIRSFPFNFTSPALFSDFISTGHINAVIRDGDQVARGFLSDMKYLENMCGSVVNGGSGGSVGLLLGNLRKLNGDGDLMVIAPWDRLFEKVKVENELRRSNLAASASSQSQPVLPLVISSFGHPSSWGSCVKLKKDTLVTNHHVIRPYLQHDSVCCSITLGKDHSVNLSEKDKVIVPFTDLDLAFIQLSEEKQLALAHVQSAPMGFAGEMNVTDEVSTVGHGLLLNHDFLDPIVSKGHLSSVIRHNPFRIEYPEIPCMLVASSQCWNGSSGGGLFDSSGKLIGIVSSNAQVFKPSVSGLQYEEIKSEKVPSFCLCIPSELVFECYRTRVDKDKKDDDIVLNDDVVKTWNLQSSHVNVFEREAKL